MHKPSQKCDNNTILMQKYSLKLCVASKLA